MRCISGSIFISLGLMDEKLFAFYCLKTFGNRDLSTDWKSIILLPFDAARQDKPNEPLFIFLRLLGDELM